MVGFGMTASDLHPWRGQLLRLPPNRVWRTYTGGRTLDSLAGVSSPADSHYAEDWLASTTVAINPVRPDEPRRSGPPEGVSIVMLGDTGYDLRDLLSRDAAYFLGASHLERHGADPRLLVKLLDPAIRLHFQVHPSAEFARRRLDAPSGKTEAYHVLTVRPEVDDPAIFLGFHSPPPRDTLRQWIETQDLVAIERAMNRVPVRAGDTFIVPGGVPHALGPGVVLVEIQEPSDLVVRFEFERAGYVLPENARFMGRGLDVALDVFDLTPWPPSRVALEARCPARRRRALGVDSYQDDLIGPERTPCFRVRLSTLRGPVTKTEAGYHVVIVTAGAGVLRVGRETHALKPFDAFVVPAGLGPLNFEPSPHLHLLECFPPD
jgi:mannose-6-phosphate isomerase